MKEQIRMFRSYEKALDNLYEWCLEQGYKQEEIERLMQYSFELGKRYKWFEIQEKRIMFQ